MTRMVMVFALSVLAPSVHAQRIYKCSDGVQAIYQSVPCPKEQDTGISRPLARDPRLTPAERQRVVRESAQARHWVREGAGYGQPPVRGTVIDNMVDRDACENARLRREMAEILGNRPVPQQLDQEIRRACAVR